MYDIIHNRIGLIQDSDKVKQAGAGPDKGEEESSHNLTIWLLILCLDPFFLLSFLAHSLCILSNHRAVTEMMPGGIKTKENSQLVLNTTTGLPLSSTFFVLPLNLCLHLYLPFFPM